MQLIPEKITVPTNSCNYGKKRHYGNLSESWAMKEGKPKQTNGSGMPGKTEPHSFCPGSWLPLQNESRRKSSQRAGPANSSSHTQKNYFTCHWQGKHSLTKSFWINYAVAGIFFQFLLGLYPEKLVTSTLHGLYVYITLYCIFLTVVIWQTAGVWRSAGEHTRKTGRKFWGYTAKGVLVLVFIGIGVTVRERLPGLSNFIDMLSRDTLIKNYSIRVLANNKEVEIAGGIKFGLTKALRKTFKEYPTIKVIHLNSYGGRVVEARLLREFIEETGLVTSTNRGCYSACTIAFMGGSSRFVYGERKLGFHRYNSADNHRDLFKKAIDESFYEDRVVFIRKGVTGKFLNQIYNTSPSDVWLPDNKDLLFNKIITDIAKTTDFSLYGETDSAGHDGLGEVLLEKAVYPVTKDPPADYKKNI